MPCVGRLVSAVALLLVSCAVMVQGLTLPEELYSHSNGIWQLELRSPCRGATLLRGNASIHNDTAIVNWTTSSAIDAHAVTLRRPNADSAAVAAQEAGEQEVFSLEDLQPFLSEGKRGYEYVICETQDNYRATPSRPRHGKLLQSTAEKTFYGVLRPTGRAGAKPRSCESTAERDVIIRALGEPSKSKKDKVEPRYLFVEMTIDTRGLPGSCASVAGAANAESAAPAKKSRRRRGNHGALHDGGAGGEGALDAVTASGVVTMRMTAFFESPSPWAIYLPFILFTVFLVLFRVISGYFTLKR